MIMRGFDFWPSFKSTDNLPSQYKQLMRTNRIVRNTPGTIRIDRLCYTMSGLVEVMFALPFILFDLFCKRKVMAVM